MDFITQGPKSIIIDGVEHSYRSFTTQNRDVPIWSDGTLDGTFVEKIIGYEQRVPLCQVVLDDFTKITFDTYRLRDDGSVIVDVYRMW